MLHSGSRGIGNQTAQHHDKIAQRRGHAGGDGLNYMRIDSPEGQDYLKVSQWDVFCVYGARQFLIKLASSTY